MIGVLHIVLDCFSDLKPAPAILISFLDQFLQEIWFPSDFADDDAYVASRYSMLSGHLSDRQVLAEHLVYDADLLRQLDLILAPPALSSVNDGRILILGRVDLIWVPSLP
jgi:hypothetical protein